MCLKWNGRRKKKNGLSLSFCCCLKGSIERIRNLKTLSQLQDYPLLKALLYKDPTAKRNASWRGTIFFIFFVNSRVACGFCLGNRFVGCGYNWGWVLLGNINKLTHKCEIMFHTPTTVVVTGAHGLAFQRDLINLRQHSLKKEQILYLFCVLVVLTINLYRNTQWSNKRMTKSGRSLTMLVIVRLSYFKVMKRSRKK
jgi:hypothetical protein